MAIAQRKIHGMTKEELCLKPALFSVKISPDEKWVAQAGPLKENMGNIYLSKIDELDQGPLLLTDYTTPGMIQYFWSNDSQQILVLKDELGRGLLQLHGFNLTTRKKVNYTACFEKVSAKIYKVSQKENKVFVGLNSRDPLFHDLYALDLNTGEWTLLLENHEFAKFLVDNEGHPVLKMRIEPDGSWTILTEQNQVFLHLSSEEAFQADFLEYDEEAKTLYWLDNRETNTNCLTKTELFGSFKSQVLGNDEKSDIHELLWVQGQPAAFSTYYSQKDWHSLDSAFEQDLDLLQERLGKNFTVLSAHQRYWSVVHAPPDQGRHFWLFDRLHREVKEINPFGVSTQTSKKLAKMYELIVKARDGQELVCYYTLPSEYDLGGKVKEPLPLVAFPHGGPFKVRDYYEYNNYHQWLAGCGYITLNVNFRLSSGFGKKFVNDGNGQWGGLAHTDVIDAVEACIEKGLTQRGRLAMLGRSYGGYETLASLVFSPDYFTCYVAFCGPSNLKTVLDGVPLFWEFTPSPLADQMMFFTKKSFIKSMGGDPDDPVGVSYLQKCSPLNYLDQIQRPLLLIHGQNDHIVRESESRQIYEKMMEKGLDVTYVVFPDEGHRFGRYENNLFYLNLAEKFLQKHLQGRYQPADKSILKASSAQVYPEDSKSLI